MVGAGGAERARELFPLGSCPLGEALAQASARGIGAHEPAGLGIDEPEISDVGKLLLAPVEHLHGQNVAAAGDMEELAPPVERAAEVGDEDDERTAARDPRHAGERLPEGRGADRLLGRLGPDGVQEPEQAGPALARRERPRRRIAERDHAEPIAVARGRVANRVGDALGDVCLPPVAGAERHRERRVEDQPGGEGPLGDLDAHVGLAGACRDVPVDEADVVAGDVRADLRELGAGAERGRSVLSGEEPVDPSSQRELERAQQLLGHRSRARAGGGARRRERSRSLPSEVDLGQRHRCEDGVEQGVRASHPRRAPRT